MEPNKLYPIYSRWLAYALRRYGFRIIKTDINPYHPEFNIWLFIDTPELQQTITSLTKKPKIT